MLFRFGQFLLWLSKMSSKRIRKGRKRKGGTGTDANKNSREQKRTRDSNMEAILVSLFLAYAEVDEIGEEARIGTDGMLRLCDDLGVEPEDPVMIVLSYFMQAKDMGIYTKTEFLRGLKMLGCITLDDLKMKLPELRSMMSSDKVYTEEFMNLYKYCYTWACEPGQRTLVKDMALSLWPMLLKPFEYKHTGLWLKFVEEQNIRGITKDTWIQFSRFINFAQVEGLASYDADSGAFPVLIDEFVDYLKKQL